MELRARPQTLCRGCLIASLTLLVLLAPHPTDAQPADLQSQEATNTSNCDFLFMLSDNIATYCQCQDSDTENLSARVRRWAPHQINQLTCRPDNLVQFTVDLHSALATVNKSLRVDYLSINTNLTRAKTKDAARGRWSQFDKLRVGHMSIQLSVGRNEVAYLEEMITEQVAVAFVGHLIDEANLQFLSIFLVELESQEDWLIASKAHDCNTTSQELRLASLLYPLVNLNRLELNFGGSGLVCKLRLESQMFQGKTKLKWLSVNSIGGVRFDEISSLASMVIALEHLSFESSNLSKFPLLSLLDPPKRGSAATNLTSLNLASNKLASLLSDLFFSEAPNQNTSDQIYLDLCSTSKQRAGFFALNQLDLSHNRLRGLTFREGQLLICTMPQLNQLFLQHNKITHLNLNSLLTFPLREPASIFHPASTELFAFKDLFPRRGSKLEYLDLSHNNLRQLTGIQSAKNQTLIGGAQIKSINLAHNQFERPINSFESRLLGKILFKESFDGLIFGSNHGGLQSLIDLDSTFELTPIHPATLCDFLSAGPVTDQYDAGLLNEVILSGNDLRVILSNDFQSSKCRDIQTLKLSQNRIGMIETKAFGHLRSLEYLDLSRNLLTSLTSDIFVENPVLRTISLSENKLTSLSKDSLLNLIELREVLLDNNELYDMPADLFAHNNKIEIIDLSRNKLTHLDESSFYNLNQLRLLNLNDNKLKEFNGNIFKLASGIRSTHTPKVLSNLSLAKRFDNSSKTSTTKQIPSKKFGHLKSQKNGAKKRHNRREVNDESSNILSLTSNKLSLFSVDSTECPVFIQNVKSLYLNDNQLTELPSSSFTCFRAIQKLYLEANRLKHIDASLLGQLTQLEHIDLSKNLIKSIEKATFASSNYLRFVDLSENRLTSLRLIDIVGTGQGDAPVQIETFNLNDNFGLQVKTQDFINFMIKISPKNMNLGYVKLVEQNVSLDSTIERLSMDSLNLSSVNLESSGLFHLFSDTSFLAMDALDLSGSVASRSTRHLFSILIVKQLQNGLAKLNLAGNQYSNHDFSFIVANVSEQTQLTSLNLSSNQLDLWPFSSGQTAKNFIQLRSVDLSFNRMRLFIYNDSTSYGFPELEILNLSHNAIMNLIDRPAQRVKSLKFLTPKLVELDLSHNRLTWIPYMFFDEMTDLTWLKLEHNQLESLSYIITRQKLHLDLSFNPQFQSITQSSSSHTSMLAENRDYLFDGLILTTDLHNQLRCLSLNECKSLFLGWNDAHETLNPFSEELVGLRSDVQDFDRSNEERCRFIMQQINSIKLNSISSRANLNTIRTSSVRFTHLSLRNNGLTKVQHSSDIDRNVISLDLAQNQIQDVPTSLCQNLVELRSLDLSSNHLKDLPELLSNCKKLTYLDLSHNQITSWFKNETQQPRKSPIMVLKLAFNVITSLENFDLDLFASLQMIDLTSNRLKVDQFLPLIRKSPPLTIIPNIRIEQGAAVGKPTLRLSNDALMVNWTSGGDYALTISPAGADKPQDSIQLDYPEKTRGLVKFCTLNTTASLIQICLKSKLDYLDQRCFHMKLPTNVSSCLSQLDDSMLGNKYQEPDSSHLESNMNQKSVGPDPVLDFIDLIKIKWIKFKELDLNAYLISLTKIKPDSMIQIDGKNSIYTVTAIKLAIVICAICIVILLITLYTFFTCIGSYNHDQLSPKNDSQSTNLTATTDTSGTSDGLHNKSTMSDTSAMQTQLSMSMTSNPRSSTSKEDSTQPPTVMERKVSLHLDANQLVQVQQQVCTTPSSSIAPSSIETAETLQAVDSIQSGTTTDNYDSSSANTYSHNPQHVATVMRMVKSNSANFNPSNKHPASNSFYGTLNSRLNNYPPLKSKMRTIHEQRNRQLNQNAVQQYMTGGSHLESSYNHVPMYMIADQSDIDEQSYHHDPTTISLLSINQALTSNSTESQQYHDSGQNSSLCHYHRLAQEPAVTVTQQNVIFEQEEDSHYHQQGDLTIPSEFPAPPPPSRAIQALEISLQQVPNQQFSDNQAYFLN